MSRRKKDTFAGLAKEARELVEAMGLNTPFYLNEGAEAAEALTEIDDSDCDHPCAGDCVRALNIVARLAEVKERPDRNADNCADANDAKRKYLAAKPSERGRPRYWRRLAFWLFSTP